MTTLNPFQPTTTRFNLTDQPNRLPFPSILQVGRQTLKVTAVISKLAVATALFVGVVGISPAQAQSPCANPTHIVQVYNGVSQLFIGTPGDDVILGTPLDDVIWGRGGNDIICGRGGNDEIHGEGGDDQLFGGRGDDDLYGDEGVEDPEESNNDILRGLGGEDYLSGGVGDDILGGGPDNDELVGGTGADDLIGHGGLDICDGSADNDYDMADGSCEPWQQTNVP